MLNGSKSGLFTDLWALGCIIYEMSCGQKMFAAKNNKELIDKILDQDFEFPSSMDKSTRDIVSKLTDLNP